MKDKKALWVYLIVATIAAFLNAWIHNLSGTIFCCTTMLIFWKEARGE